MNLKHTNEWPLHEFHNYMHYQRTVNVIYFEHNNLEKLLIWAGDNSIKKFPWMNLGQCFYNKIYCIPMLIKLIFRLKKSWLNRLRAVNLPGTKWLQIDFKRLIPFWCLLLNLHPISLVLLTLELRNWDQMNNILYLSGKRNCYSSCQSANVLYS